MIEMPQLYFSLMTRLLFLLLLLNGISHISCTAEKKSKESQGNKEEPKEEVKFVTPRLPTEVVVIGGGIAGLAAARRITSDKTNFTVTVYEARKDRYGGRVWTDKLTDMKAKGPDVELGGCALNTVAKNNPLIELVESFELKTSTIDNLHYIVPWERKTYSGDELIPIVRSVGQVLSQALNDSKSEKLELSVKEAVDKVLAKEKIIYKDSPEAYMVKSLPSYVIKDYSARNYKPEALDVGFEQVLLDGMGELIDRLVSGSMDEPPLHLSLNKVVRQIQVDKDKKKVLIRFRDGQQISADVVVVAVPSSVVASGDLLFEPPLPKKYQLAVNEINMSEGDKVIIEFEHAFWPADAGVFLRAVQADYDRGFLQTWVNVNRLIGRPVLIGFIFGPAASSFDKVGDETARALALEVLMEMFGENGVLVGGQIKRFQRSHWVSDPFSQGASTYPKVGSDPQLWETLAEPLCPYIYFAGEHTTFDGHGTLHGAYNSGIRVGDQLLTGLCEIRRKEEEEKRKKELARKKKRKQAAKNKSENDGSKVEEQDEGIEGDDADVINDDEHDDDDIEFENYADNDFTVDPDDKNQEKSKKEKKDEL